MAKQGKTTGSGYHAEEKEINRKLISFDPNLREPLWESEEDAKKAIWYGIGECDVLKIADNEIKWLTGKEDYDEGGLCWILHVAKDRECRFHKYCPKYKEGLTQEETEELLRLLDEYHRKDSCKKNLRNIYSYVN